MPLLTGAYIQIEVIENGWIAPVGESRPPGSGDADETVRSGHIGHRPEPGAATGIHCFGKQKPRTATIGGKLNADRPDSDRLPADFHIRSRNIPAAVEGKQLQKSIIKRQQ